MRTKFFIIICYILSDYYYYTVLTYIYTATIHVCARMIRLIQVQDLTEHCI